jgi:N-(5-amino-5-carboxypentanoyl)-L-cysteinyl-D-valine synthase
VVNDRLQLLPLGAIGDLCLAGDCLARSYLNKPEITNQRFVANPFQAKEENRDGKFTHIYKTGDLVRYSADGELEYLGRNDFQVKILGLRIELGEIESVLVSYPIVKQCAIIAKYKEKLHHSKQAKYLIGYYVLAGMTVLESEIKTFLRKHFPDYMVPARFFRIDGQLPVTINGKLHTRALPDVDFPTEKSSYASPRNDLETRLYWIWSTFLSINEIGIDDDFYWLGGDSILSLQLAGKIRNELSLTVSVKDVFDFRTVRRLFDNVLMN